MDSRQQSWSTTFVANPRQELQGSQPFLLSGNSAQNDLNFSHFHMQNRVSNQIFKRSKCTANLRNTGF